MRRSSVTKLVRRPDRLGPTPERLRHGPVETLTRAIADEHGTPSFPMRSIDILGVFLRRGAITAQMHAAGEDFRTLFRRSHLDPLHSAPLVRMAAGSGPVGDNISVRALHARRRLDQALASVGGPDSLLGSCLWHVVGWERPMKEWGIIRGVPEAAVRWVLLGALELLAKHFG